jgi:hypothetical protein
MGRTFLLAVCCLGASLTASAEGAKTLYYVGEAVTTTGSNVVERHDYILARTTDPEANTIAEKVVSFQRTAYAENSSVLKINQNQITLAESNGTTGGGTVTGKPWNWTFLRAEFKVPRQNMRIVDYNILSDPTSIAGHKDFYITRNGVESLVMQEDVVLHLVDQSVYEAKRKQLLGS